MSDKRKRSPSASSLSSEEAGPPNPIRPRMGTDALLNKLCKKVDFCPRKGKTKNPMTKCQKQDLIRFVVNHKLDHQLNPYNIMEMANQSVVLDFYDQTHPPPRGATSPKTASRTTRTNAVAKCFKDDFKLYYKYSKIILDLLNDYHLNSLTLEEIAEDAPYEETGPNKDQQRVKKISMPRSRVLEFGELRRKYEELKLLDVFSHLEVEDIPSFKFLQESQGLIEKAYYEREGEIIYTIPVNDECENNYAHNMDCNETCTNSGEGCTNKKLAAFRAKKIEDIKHVYLFKTSDGRGLGLKASTTTETNQIMGEYCGEIMARGTEPTSPGKWKCGYDVEYDDENTIVCDGQGSLMMFINSTCNDDYANCEIMDWYTNSVHTKLIMTKGKVLQDTELLLFYGKGHKDMVCICGALSCKNNIKYKGDPVVKWDSVV